MSDLSYKPTFFHKPWTDNVSLIQAGTPDGFNVRFAAIESDLHQVSTVVSAIDGEIDALIAGGSLGTQRLNVPLDLVGPFPVVSPSRGWSCDSTGAMHPEEGADGGRGVMELKLPEKAKLTSLRALGLYPGPPVRLSVTIARSSLFDEGRPPETLAELTDATPGMTSTYDVTRQINPDFATVDTTSFRYFLTATATQVTSFAVISLAAVQLFYTI
jgi:hypothetical protein